MSQYKLTAENWVTRVADGARISVANPPEEPNTNPDYLEYKGWLDAGGIPEPADPLPALEEQSRLVAVLNSHLDAVAAQRRYDNRFTCSLRAGFPGPFQAEGLAFAAFMDLCNMAGYSIMQAVKAGQRPVPTGAELIAELPVIEWPPSPIPEGAV